MNDYEDDYDPDYCIHGAYYKEYCEKCDRIDAEWQKHKDREDFNYWHPEEH